MSKIEYEKQSHESRPGIFFIWHKGSLCQTVLDASNRYIWFYLSIDPI